MVICQAIMLFGSHISAAGGVDKAPERAAEVGCEVFQFFSRPPQGGPGSKLTPSVIAAFKGNCKKFKQAESYIHTPYYINFASTTPRIRYGSIAVVREELERGTLLGCKYVMTHLGSTKSAGPKLGFHKTWRAVQRILDGYKGSCLLLLEDSSGAGDLVGSTFEELRDLIKNVESAAKYKNKVGVCLDSCHMFASGYDIKTDDGFKQTIDQIKATIGLDHIKLIHVNDSMVGLGEKKDRHEHIGEGKIGQEGFVNLMSQFLKIDMVLETDHDRVKEDIKRLKKLREELT